MATKEELKERIEAGIPGAQSRGRRRRRRPPLPSAVVVAPAFAGLSRIAQHRLVYDVFDGELGGRIHALSLKTKAE